VDSNFRVLYLTGGLGNQLFQYAFALNDLEVQTLIIDSELGWPVIGRNNSATLFEYRLNHRVEILNHRTVSVFIRKLGFFCIKLSSSKKLNDRKLIMPILSRAVGFIFSLHYKRRLKTFISKGVGFSKSPTNLRNHLVIGYFQTYYWPTLEKIKDELMNLELVQPSDQFEKYQQLAEIEKPLVVHIRLGDYLNETSFGIPSLKYYQTAITELFDPNTHKKIWVFTNDQCGAERIFPKEFINQVRWIPNVADSAAETLEVMRLGNDYVIGNSTYSWWGAFLSKNEKASVIAPLPWFKDSMEPNLLCPPNWKRIKAWPET
jgi:hypothetical protein